MKAAATALFLLASSGLGAGCSSKTTAEASSSAPSPSTDAAWIGIPKSSTEVLGVINKSGREPYAGPTGTLKGRVTITGDAAPDVEWSYPPECGAFARETYGKAFRVGPNKELADALVTVTGYDAFVPPAEPAVKVDVHDCAFDKRTIALGFGQRIEVSSSDTKGNISYTPFLDGAEYRAVMMVVGGGEPVKLYPLKPAVNYVLRDFQGRKFMQADVLALKYATHDVTKLDGSYEIGRIPAGGKVTVTVWLRAINKEIQKEIEIVSGENTLDLELTFDKAADKVASRPPDPFERGADPEKEAAKPGEFGGAPPPRKIPKDVPR